MILPTVFPEVWLHQECGLKEKTPLKLGCFLKSQSVCGCFMFNVCYSRLSVLFFVAINYNAVFAVSQFPGCMKR